MVNVASSKGTRLRESTNEGLHSGGNRLQLLLSRRATSSAYFSSVYSATAQQAPMLYGGFFVITGSLCLHDETDHAIIVISFVDEH